jgi:hypothetical protein
MSHPLLGVSVVAILRLQNHIHGIGVPGTDAIALYRIM